MTNSTVLFFAIVGILLSLSSYAYAYWLGRSSLRALRWPGRVASLISHLPDDSSKAWPHVCGGVLGFGGLSLLAAGLWDFYDELGRHLTIEVSALIFALLVSIAAFWTLWQTKRIEQNQAVEMFGFKVFIGQLTNEIMTLTSEVFEHPNASYRRYRLLLVTTNPYFGQLSYPGEALTTDFAAALRRSSTCAEKGLNFEILCGNENALNSFHQRYFTRNGKSEENLIPDATRTASDFLAELKGAKIHRVDKVPQIQFAVVGNVVLEFILESGAGNTDIQRYKRTHEKVVADRFQDFFRELTDLFQQSATSLPEVPKHSRTDFYKAPPAPASTDAAPPSS